MLAYQARRARRLPAPIRRSAPSSPNLTMLMSSGVYAIPRVEAEGTDGRRRTRRTITAFRGAGAGRGLPGDRVRDRAGSRPSSASTRPRCGGANYVTEGCSRTRPPPVRSTTPGDYEGALDLALRSAGLRRAARRAGSGAATRADEAARDRARLRTSRSRTRSARPSSAMSRSPRTAARSSAPAPFSHGQGHETTFAMIAAERLGHARSRRSPSTRATPTSIADRHRHVRVEVGSDRRHGSRARRRTPSSSRRSSCVADYLEANPADVVLDDRRSAASTSPARPTRRISVGGARARAAAETARLGELKAQHTECQGHPTFPFGTTSPSSRSTPRRARSSSSRWSASTTPARSSTRCIAEGQVHGGVAIGVAQALYEHYIFDEDGHRR